MRTVVAVFVFIIVAGAVSASEPEIFWRETPTKKIKLKLQDGKEVGRWEFPKSGEASKDETKPETPMAVVRPKKKIPLPPNFNRTYDKFKNYTHVRTKKKMNIKGKHISGELVIGLVFITKGKTSKGGFQKSITFRSISEDWVFIRKHSSLKFRMIIDGVHSSLELTHHDSDVSPAIAGNCWESLFFRAKDEMLDAMANAKKIECQLGYYEFELGKQFRKHLNDFQAYTAGI